MKWTRLFLLLMTFSLVLWANAQDRGGRGAQRGAAPAGGGAAMTLSIGAFADGAQIPVKLSQAAEGVAPGEGTSPAIAWANVPAGTQSFVLHMHDMELARNRTTDDQVHWLVWNIPGSATGLPEGVPNQEQAASGAQGKNSSGKIGYGGPCPPPGKPHRYFFKLYALDSKLSLKPGARKPEVEAAMKGHVLAQAELMGKYGR